MLAHEVRPGGRVDGPKVVLAHGFGQTRRCWGPALDGVVAQSGEVVLVDAPGHGESDGIRPGWVDGVDALGRTGGRAVYVGYSMGGRSCLQLALRHPELVAGLVLVGASPGLADPDDRAARRAADDALAARIEEIGVSAFVAEWLALPLFAGLEPDVQFRAERATNTAAGLAASLRDAGTGAQPSLWAELPELARHEIPVLLLTGEADAKFTAIAAAMAEAVSGPHVEQLVVARAGHSVHLEQPEATVVALTHFLSGRSAGA